MYKRQVKAPIKKKSRASMASASSSKSDMGSAEPEQSKVTSLDDIVKLIKGVDTKLDNFEDRLGARINQVDGKLEDKFAEVSEEVGELRDRVDSNEARLEERITAVLRKHQADNLEEKIEESIITVAERRQETSEPTREYSGQPG